MVLLRRSVVNWSMLLCACSWTVGGAQQSSPAKDQSTTTLRVTPIDPRTPVDPNHPLHRAIRIARNCLVRMQREVKDYTCVLVKRERIQGELLGYEHALVKCRHARVVNGKTVTPFSVYMKFQAPKRLADREVLYVKGRDRGDILVRKGGRRTPYLNMWIDPHGEMALRDNRYPITEFGIENLVRRLLQVASEDSRHQECEVNYFQGAKVDGRVCGGIEVRHPYARQHFRYHLARILIDDELQVPIHYAAFTWPPQPGDPPVLLEEYTYRDMRLNVGLSDRDFDRNNPAYGFRKSP